MNVKKSNKAASVTEFICSLEVRMGMTLSGAIYGLAWNELGMIWREAAGISMRVLVSALVVLLVGL